jgi:hypothetical protein
LLDINTVISELGLQITRQSVGASIVGSSGNEEQPLPFDEAASNALDELIETLEPWTQEVSTKRYLLPSLDKQTKARLFVGVLLYDIVKLSRHEHAGTAFEELRYAHRRALQVIDRQAGKIPLGSCECGRPVHAREGSRTVMCSCGTIYDVLASQARTKEFVDNYLITATEAAKMGEVKGRRFNTSTIRSWVRRNQLAVRDVDPATGENLYRFGDLVELSRRRVS